MDTTVFLCGFIILLILSIVSSALFQNGACYGEERGAAERVTPMPRLSV